MRTFSLIACALVGFANDAYAAGKAKPDLRATRYSDAKVTFEHPEGATVSVTTDVIAENAFAVAGLPDGILVTVLVGDKPIKATDLELTFEAWHSARIKNRVAWGMRSDGGPPRETIHVGDRRAMRQRDRIGGKLYSTEQTFTCALASARVICTVTSAPIGKRDFADGLAAKILSSVEPRK